MPTDPSTGKRKPGRPRKDEQVAEPAQVFGAVKAPEVASQLMERFAQSDFGTHQFPRRYHRYVWERDGKVYSLLVTQETTHLNEVTSFEVRGPGSVWLKSSYRGPVLVGTNDPKLQHKIEPDPGPQVTCEAEDGTATTMSVEDFLRMVNANKARAMNTVRRRR